MARKGVGWSGKVRVFREKVLPEMRWAAREGLRLGDAGDMRELTRRWRAPVICLPRISCPLCGELLSPASGHEVLAYGPRRRGTMMYYGCPGGGVVRMYVLGATKDVIGRARAMYDWLKG